MSRLQPYRPKMPVHVMQLLDVASRITLFLVGQTGPFSFTFKDRLDNKFKTTIGAEVKCSCAPHRNDHCIHSIYVMLRIFRISVDNHLMWQAAYLDNELQDIVKGKHTMVQSSRSYDDILPSQLAAESVRPTRPIFKVIPPQAQISRLTLDETATCPICQDPVTVDMCLTFCKARCGNNFHLECLKVWVDHKVKQQVTVTCPMCRADFPETISSDLEDQERKFKRDLAKKMRVKFDCNSCGVSIPINTHKCLLCEDFKLCECCYIANKHSKHPFIRQDPNGKWRGASERKSKQQEPSSAKLCRIEQDPNRLLDFVAAAYPFVSKYISDNIDSKLNFSPTDLRCFVCESSKMLFMRRLNCGHFVDHECLKKLVTQGKFHCGKDGVKILKGYQHLLAKEKQLTKLYGPTTDSNEQSQFGCQYNFMNDTPTTLDKLLGDPNTWQTTRTRAQPRIEPMVDNRNDNSNHGRMQGRNQLKNNHNSSVSTHINTSNNHGNTFNVLNNSSNNRINRRNDIGSEPRIQLSARVESCLRKDPAFKQFFQDSTEMEPQQSTNWSDLISRIERGLPVELPSQRDYQSLRPQYPSVPRGDHHGSSHHPPYSTNYQSPVYPFMVPKPQNSTSHPKSDLNGRNRVYPITDSLQIHIQLPKSEQNLIRSDQTLPKSEQHLPKSDQILHSETNIRNNTKRSEQDQIREIRELCEQAVISRKNRMNQSISNNSSHNTNNSQFTHNINEKTVAASPRQCIVQSPRQSVIALLDPPIVSVPKHPIPNQALPATQFEARGRSTSIRVRPIQNQTNSNRVPAVLQVDFTKLRDLMNRKLQV